MNKKREREWDYCPTCGNSLDTGWECAKCGLDWMGWAYPRWARWVNGVRVRFLIWRKHWLSRPLLVSRDGVARRLPHERER